VRSGDGGAEAQADSPAQITWIAPAACLEQKSLVLLPTAGLGSHPEIRPLNGRRGGGEVFRSGSRGRL